jgi:beta-fructofuranosidase
MDNDRPASHLTPPTGWMNDPNGMVFRDGALHVFYQYEPDRPRWGRMRWGHAMSHDLMRWEHLPIALEPGVGGPDEAGCWSGCQVVDDAGRPTIFYTGVRRENGIRRASICLATSADGLLTWTKLESGAVIRRPPRGIRPDRFRDPFVWRDEAGWAMLVGAGTVRGRGAVLLYRSDDMVEWRYDGPFLTTEDVVASDPDVIVDDIDSPCWECPQLVRFEPYDLLIVSVVDRSQRVRPAHVIAYTGLVRDGRFLVHHTERLGLGPDFYAPATVAAPDGRHLLLGWIPEDPPGDRSSRTWAGSLTFPRVVSVDTFGRARLDLAAEVDWLGGRPERLPDATVSDGEPWSRSFGRPRFEIRTSVRPADAVSIRFDISGGSGPLAEIRYDPRDRRLTVVRSARVTVAGRDPHGTTVLPPAPDGAVHLRLVVDGSVLEMVADDRVTATARLPEIGHGDLTLTCTTLGGSCLLTELDVFAPATA